MPDARLYKTGDLARWLADGNLEFLGRNDFQIKLHGFRIELGEIESALLQHPAVRQAAVVVRDGGAGDKQLVGYIVVDSAEATANSPETDESAHVTGDVLTGASSLAADLRNHLQGLLPDYMIPAALVELDALPLTPNGKLDRKALPAPGNDARMTEVYQAPKGAVEITLAALWSELLDRERIGRNDNFFELGGHSLLAVRLAREIRHAMGIEMPLGLLFALPTLGALAKALPAAHGDFAALVPLQTQGERQPLFLLPGAIGSVLYLAPLAHALGESRPVLALPTPGLDGRPTPATVAELAEHHLRALRRRQPHGPYYLAGHSSGGRVVFEMAWRLQQQGETVGLLTILDTMAPDSSSVASVTDRTETVLLRGLLTVFAQLGGVDTGPMLDELTDEIASSQAYAVAMGFFQKHGLLFAKDAPLAELHALVEVYRATTQAHVAYRAPGRLHCPILLLRASEHSEAEDAAINADNAGEDLGWAALSEAGAEVAFVPGSHVTMVTEPHVQTLARHLTQALNDAERLC